MKFHGFHGNPLWILKNECVWGSPNEQFVAHEKVSWGGGGGMQGTLNLPPGNTIHVNLRKHDCCVALPHDATDLSAVCDCGIS